MSLFTVIFFSVLQYFIFLSVQRSPDSASKQYAEAMHENSLKLFKALCITDDYDSTDI